MKIIVTRAREDGTFDEVGMSNRWLFSDITTERGAINRAKNYAQNRPYRIEFFHADHFYNSDPFRIVYS